MIWHPGRTLAAARRDELARNAAAVLTLRVVSIALEFVAGLVLARWLLAIGYGVYAYVISWVTLLAVPATAGFDRLMLRESGALAARREWGQLAGLHRRARGIVLAAGCAIVGLGFVTADRWLGMAPGGGLTQAFRIGLLCIPFIAWSRLNVAGLQGLGQPVRAGLAEGVLQPLFLLAGIAAIAGADIAPSAAQAVAVYAGAVVISCTVATILMRRALPADAHAVPREFRTRVWLRQALPFVFMLGMNVLLTHTDVVMLGWLDSATTSGIYRIAWQVAAVTALPLAAMNASFAPRITMAHAAGNLPQLEAEARRAARLTLLMSLPIAAVLWLAGGRILAIFGAPFTSGYASLAILTFGQLVNAAAGSVGYLLIMTGHERAAAAGLGAAAVSNVLLNAWLIPVLGMEGAALASCVTLIGLNVAFAMLVRRRLGLRMILL